MKISDKKRIDAIDLYGFMVNSYNMTEYNYKNGGIFHYKEYIVIGKFGEVKDKSLRKALDKAIEKQEEWLLN